MVGLVRYMLGRWSEAVSKPRHWTGGSCQPFKVRFMPHLPLIPRTQLRQFRRSLEVATQLGD